MTYLDVSNVGSVDQKGQDKVHERLFFLLQLVGLVALRHLMITGAVLFLKIQLPVALLHALQLALWHNREAVCDFEEVVDVLTDLIVSLSVENPAVMTRANVADRDLARLTLPLRLLVQALDIDLAAHVVKNFAFERDPLKLVNLIQLFRDAQFVADFERPEDPANAYWNAEAPQILQVHIKLAVGAGAVSTALAAC